MIEILFEINGKRIDTDDIADGPKRSALKLLEAFIIEDVGNVRCPVHGTEPRILCNVEHLNNLSLEFFGCCDELVQASNAAIITNTGGDSYQRKHHELLGDEAHKIKRRLFCGVCKRETTHILQYAQTTGLLGQADFHEGIPYMFNWHVWLIWRCKDCLNLRLEQTGKTTEWFEGNSWEDYDYEALSSFDDEIQSAKQESKLKSFLHVPRKIREGYKEVVTAYEKRLGILCTIGIRSLIEELTEDKRVPKDKEFWKRIENLPSSLGIPIGITENLKGVKELGNRAAHDLKPAKREDLQMAIELIEEILHFVYELEPKTRKLKRHQKKQTPKKV